MQFPKRLPFISLGIITIALICGTPTEVVAALFSRVYAFGDSLADNGNFYQGTTIYPIPPGVLPFPGGPDAPGGPGYPALPYYQGRFSNGPVWVETLTELLELPTSSLEDYAVGGSTTGFRSFAVGLPPIFFPGLLSQVNNFTRSTQPADPNALYIISVGTNDYNFDIPSDRRRPYLVEEPQAIPSVIRSSITNINTAVMILAEKGARNFIVAGLPDLGKLPTYTQNPTLTPSDLQLITDTATVHNKVLTFSLQQLSRSLDVNIATLDLFTLLNDAITNPTQLWLTNVTEPCYSFSADTLCNTPDEYLFWDSSHPTVGAHREIALLAQSQLQQLSPSLKPGLEPLRTYSVRIP
jgi:outer membrane lipase/esterase